MLPEDVVFFIPKDVVAVSSFQNFESDQTMNLAKKSFKMKVDIPSIQKFLNSQKFHILLCRESWPVTMSSEDEE